MIRNVRSSGEHAGGVNISSTRWRTVVDHARKLYFFESALTPNTFWVDLKKIDFATAAGTRKLELGRDQDHVYAGDATGEIRGGETLRLPRPQAVGPTARRLTGTPVGSASPSPRIARDLLGIVGELRPPGGRWPW